MFSLFNIQIYNPLFYFLSIFKFGFSEKYQDLYFHTFKLLFLYVVITFATSLGWTLSLNLLFKEKENVHGTARFATKRDIRKNGFLHKSGIVIGECSDAKVIADKQGSNLVLHLNKASDLVCHPGKIHSLVLASSGQGKGVSIILPTLLSWNQSVICFDPKSENFNITAGYRKTFSHVIKFAPCEWNTVRFNPVMAIRDGDEYAYRDASLLASILFAPSKVGGGESDNSAFFNNSAKDIITGSLLHIRFSDFPDKSFHGLMDFWCSESMKSDGKEASDKKQTDAMINARHYYIITQQMYNNRPEYYKLKGLKIGDEIEAPVVHDLVVKCANRTANRNEKSKADVMSTLFTKIQLFEDPVLANATSGSDFVMEDFIESDKPISLYLCVPDSDIDRLSFIVRVIVTFMLKKFTEGETNNNAVRLKNKVLFLLDEFPRLGCFPDIPAAMGICRGYGVFFMIVCQALNQLSDLYGPNHPFLDHCTCRVVFGTGSLNDSNYFSDQIGQESIQSKKLSRNGLIKLSTNNLSFSSNDYGRKLLDAADILRIPGDQALLMVHGMQPYLMKKVVYYEDPRFTWKLDYKAPSSLFDLYREIADLPSRIRIKESIKKRFEEDAMAKNINDVDLPEDVVLELEEEFCMSDDEEYEYHELFNQESQESDEPDERQEIKNEVYYKYGTSETVVIADYHGETDDEENSDNSDTGIQDSFTS